MLVLCRLFDEALSLRLDRIETGDSLAEDDARIIAENALIENFDVNIAQLKKVSVTPEKLDNRTDWEFVWADTLGHPLKSGECRLVVQLAGNQIVNVYQTVHVPEEWSRAERERRNLVNILDYAFGALPFLLLAVAFVFGIISWSRKQFNVPLFIKISILLIINPTAIVMNSPIPINDKNLFHSQLRCSTH